MRIRIIRCGYCANWQASPIHSIIKQINNDEDDSKKKKKKKKNEPIQEYRTCQVNNRKIKRTAEICRYFKPRLYFYCYPSRYWLSIFQCLHRRRNRDYHFSKKGKQCYLYPDCTVRCSQFREDILPICQLLKINRLGNIKRQIEKRKIKRRQIEKRKIKRRNNVKRSITRRNK